MDVPSARSMARASWNDVQKTRASLHAQVTDVRKDRGIATYTAIFEAIEQKLSQLRLACMQVIFHDFEYAADKKAEHTLWQAHTSVNSEYRRVVGRLGGQSHVVQKRKVERMYKDFLKTSQSFYCGYVQRLASRFYIPELSQAAQGLQVRPTGMPSRDASLPDPMRTRVTNSCQRSLVHLGDLARYRCQMSDKSTKTSFDTALAYYGLANVVDPDNGSAHHQMAVLYQLQAQHFEIVYHFHRAIAIANPHELGVGNLEREYRGLHGPSSSQAGTSADAMVFWFVRLHGFYSQGEAFSQQVELETEVLHRTERAYKTGTHDQSLLRMALINIAAYEIGTTKVKEAWTLNASRTCQFLLRWTIRSIVILLQLIKTELQDDLRRSLASIAMSDMAGHSTTLNPSIHGQLGLLRIYIAWIYTVRTDIVEYRDFLEPHVSEAYRLLADTLTLLNSYCQQATDTVTSAYLLSEDIEAVGLRPLEDRRLPLFFHMLEKQGTQTSKRYKARKPRKEIAGVSHQEHDEMIWRVRDIICCGVLLAGSAHFPVSITAVKYPDGRQTEGWVFTEEHPAASYITEVEMSCMLERLERPGPAAANSPQTSRASPTPPSPRLVSVSSLFSRTPASDTEKLADRFTGEAASDRDVADQPSLKNSIVTPGDSEINQDNEMLDMVNKLLDPADEGDTRNASTSQESSYGMSTSTANAIFGHIPHNLGHASPVTREIPSLPWEHFYNASWKESPSQARGQPGESRPSLVNTSFSGREILATGPDRPGGQRLDPGAGLRDHGRGVEGSSGDVSLSRWLPSYSRDVEERPPKAPNSNSRHAVLETLAQALHAEHAPSSRNSGLASMLTQTDPRLVSSAGALAKKYNSTSSSSHETWSQTRHYPAPMSGVLPLTPDPDSKSPGPFKAGGPFAEQVQFHDQQLHLSGFKGSDGKQSTSRSFNLAGYGRVGSQDTRSLPLPGSLGSSVTFSHPSSLFGGTPDAISVPRAELRSHPVAQGIFSSNSMPAEERSLGGGHLPSHQHSENISNK